MAATYEQVIDALMKADAAGNTEDARILAQTAATMRPAGGGRGVMGGPTAPELERASMSNYLLESAKRGVTATPARLTAGSAMQQGTFAGAFPTQPELEEVTTENVQKRMGVNTSLTPATKTQKYLGAVVEGATDPLNLFGPGKLLNVAAGGMAGGAGELGGEVGLEVGGRVGQLFGGLTAALVSGAGTMKLGGMVKDKITGTSDLLKSLDPDQIASIEGTSKAQDLIKKALDANPELNTRLDDIRKRMQFVTGNTGPLAVAGLDNLTLNKKLQELASGDIKLAGDLQKLYADLNVAVRTKADELYPKPTTELPSASKRVEEAQVDYQKRTVALDNQLKKITSDIDLFGSRDPVAEGKAIQNLVKTQESTIRKELSPQYDDVKKQASDQGALLPANETQALLNAAEEIFMSDPWAKQAGLLNLVRQQASKFNKLRKDVLPKGEAGALSTSEENMLVGMDITSLDSLKRRVSDDLYGKNKVTDPNRRDKLKLFQQYVDGALERVQTSSGNVEVNLRGERMSFADAMSTLDRDYYTKIGIDFRDAKSIAKLNSQDYAERVGTQLASEPTATDQFLKVAGDEGVPIVERAIMARLYNRALGSDGYLDPNKLNNLMSKDSQNGGFRDLLARVPALRDRLQDASTRSLSLMSEKQAIDDAAKATRVELGTGFLNDYEQGGVDRIVTKMTGATGKGYQAKFKNDLSKLSTDDRTNATLAVRSSLVNKMLDSTDPMGYLAKNKDAFISVFGKQHTNNLMALADVQQLAGKIDIDRLPIKEAALKESSVFERYTGGISPKQITGVLVNQIASLFNKGYRIVSMIGQSKIDEATRQAHYQLFMDNDGVDKMIKATSKLKTKDGKDVDLKALLDPKIAREVVNSVMIGAGRSMYTGGSVAASESTLTPQVQEDQYIYNQE
jgi:hypothetical protein